MKTNKPNFDMKISTFLLLFFSILTLQDLKAQKTDSLYHGIASYYHLRFNGRKTSNGERFSNDSLTAAHKTFPFGTMVKVVNLSTNEFVIVRVNDRLPKNSKRSIDLTQAAARKLGIIKKGLQKVELSIMRKEQIKQNTVLEGEPLRIDGEK